jgi:hypothetical protein
VNLLDENIPLEQRDLLRAWGIRCRVIGQDVARASIGDDNIIALLHRLKQPTLFTRDVDFFDNRLAHDGYTLVWLDVLPDEAALYVRRFLRHPQFQTKAQRSGTVVRVHHDGIEVWERHRSGLRSLAWATG